MKDHQGYPGVGLGHQGGDPIAIIKAQVQASIYS